MNVMRWTLRRGFLLQQHLLRLVPALFVTTAMLGCGPAAEPALQPGGLAVSGSVASPRTPEIRLTDPLQAVPADATLYLRGPVLEGPWLALLSEVQAPLALQLAKALGVDRAAAADVLADLEQFGGFVPKGGLRASEPAVVMILRFKDGGPARKLLAATRHKRLENGQLAFEAERGSMIYGLPLDGGRALLLSPNRDALNVAASTASGQHKSIVPGLSNEERDAPMLLSADVANLLGNRAFGWSEPSTISFRLEQSGSLATTFKLTSTELPALGTLLSPLRPALLDQLPEGAALLGSTSLKRAPRKTVEDVVLAFAGAVGRKAQVQLGERLVRGEIGFGFAEIESTLGDEVAWGVYPSTVYPSTGATKGSSAAKQEPDMLALLSVKDRQAAGRLLEQLGKALKAKRGRDVLISAGQIVVDLGKAQEMRVVLRKTDIAISRTGKGGSADLMRKLETRAASSTFGTLEPGHAFWVMSPSGLASLVAPGGELSADLSSKMNVAALELSDYPDGLAGRAKVEDGATMLGTTAAIAAFGVRRYLTAAKTAEAKSMLGAVTRSATAAFEREQVDGSSHQLCRSAVSVPAQIPAGITTDPGDAFEQGDNMTGWRCLKFAVSHPMRFRLSYRQGKDYLGPKIGGVDPGPNGFEVTAEGDLDGDGTISTYIRTGKVNPKTNQVELAPDLFVVNDGE